MFMDNEWGVSTHSCPINTKSIDPSLLVLVLVSIELLQQELRSLRLSSITILFVVEMRTLDGLVKDRTQCAPNGYYFIPVYDKELML
ncbi:hypothetical protein QVD17_29333 [Tagetes erecta]|uniref:NOMO-like N-terminal beta-sandwich domain-containing protein n=1 Tax=Tagetes erecta TaxID=13708 RepID=A0AAD8KBM2_TARER|nr:hypothetical protein QVD17_29333 [Tagetes erecta]